MITPFNLILLVILVFITHILVTFFHELAHRRALEKNKIRCEIKWNLHGIRLFRGFAMAGCFFDEKKFNKLGLRDKKEILFAGIKTELVFIGLFLILAVIAGIYALRSFVFYYFSVTFITLIGKLLLNFFEKGSDWHKWRRGV